MRQNVGLSIGEVGQLACLAIGESARCVYGAGPGVDCRVGGIDGAEVKHIVDSRRQVLVAKVQQTFPEMRRVTSGCSLVEAPDIQRAFQGPATKGILQVETEVLA